MYFVNDTSQLSLFCLESFLWLSVSIRIKFRLISTAVGPSLTPSPPHLPDWPLSLTASATLAFVFLEEPKHVPAPGPLHLPFFSAECLFLPLFTYLCLIFSKCQKMSLFRGLLDYSRERLLPEIHPPLHLAPRFICFIEFIRLSNDLFDLCGSDPSP